MTMANSRRRYAFNRTRQAFLASDLRVADTHWMRLKGLIGSRVGDFDRGQGLWIIPSHGVHTMFMQFPIDVLYLDENNVVLHTEENVRPWRVTPIRTGASSVLELPARTLFVSGTAVGDEIEIRPIEP
jgi:uncharacterized membrane protein (UPF0127 family)